MSVISFNEKSDSYLTLKLQLSYYMQLKCSQIWNKIAKHIALKILTVYTYHTSV